MIDTKKEEKAKKVKTTGPPTKIVIRHLPPNLTQAEFLDVVSPLPDHNYFSFCAAEKSIVGHCHSRAYINFKNPADIYTFRDQFDGYVFVDQEGNEGTALVEYAPFQKVFQRDAVKQIDKKCGTILDDEEYIQFLHSLENPEPVSVLGTDKMLEEISRLEILLKAKESSKTPLMEYLEERRSERKRPVEYISERMQRKECRRQLKLERQAKRDEARKLRDEKRRGIIRKEDKEPLDDLPEYMKRAHAKYYKRIEEHYYDKRERRSLRRALERDEKRKEMERLNREDKGEKSKRSRPVVEVGKPYKEEREAQSPPPAEEKRSRPVVEVGKPYKEEREAQSPPPAEEKRSKRYSVLKRNILKKNTQEEDKDILLKREEEFSSQDEGKKKDATKEFDFENERLVFVNKRMLNRGAGEYKGSSKVEIEEEDLDDVGELDEEFEYESETRDSTRNKSEKDLPENTLTDNTNLDSNITQYSNVDPMTDIQDTADDNGGSKRKEDLSEKDNEENLEDENDEKIAVLKEETKAEERELDGRTKERTEKKESDVKTKEGNEEKESDVKIKEGNEEVKSSRNDPRLERKIRNKDRPSLQIYRPGQSRLSRLNSKQEDDKVNKSTSGENDSSSNPSTPSPTFGESQEKSVVKKTVRDSEEVCKAKTESNKEKITNAREKITNVRPTAQKDQTKRPNHGTRVDFKKNEYASIKDHPRTDNRKNDHGSTKESSTSKPSGYSRNNAERRPYGGRGGGRSFTNRKFVSNHQGDMVDTPNSSQSQDDVEHQPPAKPQGKRYSKIRTKVTEKVKELSDE